MMNYLIALIFAFFVSTPVCAQDATQQDSVSSEKQETVQELNEAQIFERQLLARRDAKQKRGRTKRLSGTKSGSRSKSRSSSSSSSSSGSGFSLSSGMFVK